MQENHIQSNTCVNSESTCDHINTIALKYSIPQDVLENAISLYEKSWSAGILVGRSKHLALLTTLYVCCRQENIPLSLQDIAFTSNIKIKNLSKCVRILIDSFSLQLELDYFVLTHRIVDDLKLREKLKRDAMHFMSKASESGICIGKKPLTMAAAVVYLSCKINKERGLLRKISIVSGIHATTIRHRAQLLSKILHEDMCLLKQDASIVI